MIVVNFTLDLNGKTLKILSILQLFPQDFKNIFFSRGGHDPPWPIAYTNHIRIYLLWLEYDYKGLGLVVDNNYMLVKCLV